MCIEVRVTYPRCFHVHLGYELCVEIDADYGDCLRFETHPRLDPFCPLCSKSEYRAHRLQSSWGNSSQQHSQAMTLSRAALPVGQSQFYCQLQPMVGQDCGSRPQRATDDSKRPSWDGSVAVSDLFSEVQSPNAHSSPPSPIEPPIHPTLLGPHQFLEYRQTLAMVVVTDRRPRLGQQDWRKL